MPVPEITPVAAHTRDEFLELSERIEPCLEALLASPVYGRGPGCVAPPRFRGVYPFTELQGGEQKQLALLRPGGPARAGRRGRRRGLNEWDSCGLHDSPVTKAWACRRQGR